MKMISLAAIAAVLAGAGAGAAFAAERTVSLTADPLVMRLGKDEFRIAFGINGEGCAANGCNGSIRYQVEWKAVDGTTRRETKRVNYIVPPHAHRTLAVDRQYFDTAEGKQTIDVVKVSVAGITCADGV
jgi:hypothetical protein